MQCGCPYCGVLMGQVQHGLDSHCQCPYCGFTCRDCLDRKEGFATFHRKGEPLPMSEEMLRFLEGEEDPVPERQPPQPESEED